jgi:hypothetical protein
MADPVHDKRPVMEYAAPSRRSGRRLVAGHVLGLAATAVLVVGGAFLGAVIDTHVNEGQNLAGLAGLAVGGVVGVVLVIAGAVAAWLAGRRRDSALLRGAGQGMLLSLGLGALGIGLCSVL